MKKGLKLLIISDLLVVMSFGLISPIFAIFIKEDLIGGSAFAAGAAISITLITRSLLQIPFGKVEDHHSKKRFIMWGTLIIGFIPLGYLFINNVYQLYVLQVIYGIGSAMAFPAFAALLTHYLDRGREAYEWSVYGTTLGFGSAFTAIVGGYVADTFSFNSLFLAIFIISVVGWLVLFKIPPEHFKKKKFIKKK